MSLFLSVFVFLSVAHAEPKIPKAVLEYSVLLKDVRLKKTSLEPVFLKGYQAINELGDDLSKEPDEVDQKLLSTLRKHLEGFELNPNTETVVAHPDIAFFLALSKTNGRKEDIAFLELTKQTYSESTWPVYIHQQTDLGGCTNYDGTLSRLYRGWKDFRNKHPKAFVAQANGELERIEQELKGGTCACNTETDLILKELEGFVREFPKAKIDTELKSRIALIKTGKSPIRLSCVVGT